MGFLGLFGSKDPTVKIEKLTKKFLNEHQQQQVRQEAMEDLLQIDHPQAVVGLIKRLGVNFRDTIKNEQEKKWVHRQLIDRYGDQAIEPLENFVRDGDTISAAIQTLKALVTPDHLRRILLTALKASPPEDHRSFEKRLQLIDALADEINDEVIEACVPYLGDHDDGVRLKVFPLLEAHLSKNASFFDAAVEKLIDVISDPMASGAITRRAASLVSKFDLDLRSRAESLGPLLPDGFVLGSNGRLKRG